LPVLTCPEIAGFQLSAEGMDQHDGDWRPSSALNNSEPRLAMTKIAKIPFQLHHNRGETLGRAGRCRVKTPEAFFVVVRAKG
jgi:hypothetical protein